MSDAGVYKCSGTNSKGKQFNAFTTIIIIVGEWLNTRLVR